MLPVLLLGLPALAVVAEPDRVVVTDRIAVGVYADGSLCNPTVYSERGKGLCLLWDPDGPEGPLPPGGDWMWPGDPVEAWSATWTASGVEASLLNGGPEWKEGLTFTWDNPDTSASLAWIHGTAATTASRILATSGSFCISAEPAMTLQIFLAGQPMLMSMICAPFSALYRAAWAIIAGSAPAICTEIGSTSPS